MTEPLAFAPIDTPELVVDNTMTQSTEPQIGDAPQAEKPKKRGRPRKDATQGQPASAPKVENPGSIFEAIKKEVEANEKTVMGEPGTTGEAKSPIHESASKVVDGYMLLMVMDSFFPLVLQMIFKKRGIKASDLRLSKEQKEHLTPMADEVAMSLLSWLDPITLFFVMCGGMYWQNAQDAMQFQAIADKKRGGDK